MVRSELIARLAKRFPALLRQGYKNYPVSEILGAISGALIRDDRVEIRGFGVFHLNSRPPRVGRNPKTGESVYVPTKYLPHFKAWQGYEGGARESAASSDGTADCSMAGKEQRPVFETILEGLAKAF